MKKKGITLIELIVVMTIIIIITAASIPSFLKFTNTARLRAGARDITTALRTTRRLAITTRVARAVKIYLYDHEADQYKNAVTFYETADAIKTQWAAANIYFIDGTVPSTPSPSPHRLTFTFKPRGTTSCGAIRVVDPNDRYIKITVQGTTGRVKIGEIQ